MMRARGIPYPRTWDTTLKELRLLAIGMPGFALLFLVASSLSGDEVFAWICGIFFVGMSAYFVGFFFWRVFSTYESAIEVAGGRALFVLHESRVAKVLYLLTAVAGVVTYFLMARERGLFMREVDFSSRGEVFGLVGLILSPVIWLALVAGLLVYVVGRAMVKWTRVGVGMDARGIYHWWWAGCSFYPWEEISDIELMRPIVGPSVRIVVGKYAYEASSIETTIGRSPSVRRRNRKLNLGSLRTHPGLAYQALFFYLRNPELREELEDERSVERMRRRDYGKIPLEIEMHGRALSPCEAVSK